MPCCKAKRYFWCKDLPVVDYKDEECKEYCIFHAPQDKKGISVKEFNEKVFEIINTAKANNQICDLSVTIFEGDISFSQFDEGNPLPSISFSGAKFSGREDFSGTVFSGETDFQQTIFDGRADFFQARFGEEADFSRAIFSGEADFFRAKFFEEVNFLRATFSEVVEFSGEAFIKGAIFEGLNIKEKVRFEIANLEKVSFLDTDLRKIDFINCDWPKKGGRNVLYDEIELFKKEKGKDFKDKIKKVEILYRMLKRKYKEEHNEPEVSNWHYGEKEMFRKGSLLRRYFPLSLSNLYWLSSGYGERPVRAGIVLFLLILAISVLSGLAGLGPFNQTPPYEIAEIKGWTDIKNFQNFWALFLNTLQYATFEKEPNFIPKTIYGDYLKLAARILIPLQAALFALAVRNRFRR